jgi:hypothetical protein
MNHKKDIFPPQITMHDGLLCDTERADDIAAVPEQAYTTV